MIIENGNWTVYCHINKVNGKKYVGITSKKPNQRWRTDGSGYRPKACNTSHFWNAIQKYGWDNFSHEIIATCLTEDEASNFERLLISSLKTTNPTYGYNATDGGLIGSHPTAETRAKIAVSRMGSKNPMYGGLSEEHKAKISKAITGEGNPFYGKKHTLEAKAKIAEAHRRENLSAETLELMCIKHLRENLSDETKRKMSDGRRGEKNHQFGKRGGLNANAIRVTCYNKMGDPIMTYDSIVEAAEATHVDDAQISACCKRKPHYNTAGGYIWRYAEEETA